MKDNTNLFNGYCDYCKTKIIVDETDMFPGKGVGVDGDEFLEFYIKCPFCSNINKFDIRDIPDEIIKYRMELYAGVADQELELLKTNAKILELQNYKIKLVNSINSKLKKQNRDTNHLYDGWLNNDEVIKQVKKLSK